jgi:ATP-dependent DNA helicase PIF1
MLSSARHLMTKNADMRGPINEWYRHPLFFSALNRDEKSSCSTDEGGKERDSSTRGESTTHSTSQKQRTPLRWDQAISRAFSAPTPELVAQFSARRKIDELLSSRGKGIAEHPSCLAEVSQSEGSHFLGGARKTEYSSEPAEGVGIKEVQRSLPPSKPLGPLPYPSPSTLHSKSHPPLHGQQPSEVDESFAESLVFNPLTNRMNRVASPTMHGLADIGIRIDRKTMKLVMSSPELFDGFAKRIRTQEYSFPIWWNTSIGKKLGFNVLNASEPHKLAAEALALEYRIVELRKESIGAVYASGAPSSSPRRESDDGAEELNEGSAVSAAVSNVNSALDAVSNIVRSAPATTNDDDMQNHAPQSHRHIESLTPEQQQVLKLVASGHNLYLGGGAGTGKTATLLNVREFLQGLGLHVAMTATTGVAAHQISGTTFHRAFGVKISGDIANIEAMKRFDVVIIDEISMFPKKLFEQFDLSMRRARGKPHLPFGGCQMILCGDFMQLSAISDEPILGSTTFRNHFVMLKLSTVIRQSALSEFSIQLQLLRRGVVTESLKSSLTHLPPGQIVKDAINLLPTNEQVREANAAELEKLPGEPISFIPHVTPLFLLGEWTKTVIIRIGNLASFSFSEAFSAMTVYFSSSIFQSQTLFGHNISFYPVFSDAYALRVRISPWMSAEEVEVTKQKIDSIGEMIAKLQCAAQSEMTVAEIIENGSGLQTEKDESRLEHLCNASPFNQPLQLKHGAKVMLRANLSPTLVNGTVGKVVGFVESRKENVSKHLLTLGGVSLEAAMEQYNHFCKYELDMPMPLLPVCQFGDRIETIPPHGFVVGGQIDSHFYATTVVALPLTLAYAFTVHKVQGLTLHGRVHLELSRMWQCNHLLYVAMSRVKNPSQLTLSAFDERLVKVAEECLVFDESLPCVEDARVLPSFIAAAWRRVRQDTLPSDITKMIRISLGSGSLRGTARKLRRGLTAQHALMRRRVAEDSAELERLAGLCSSESDDGDGDDDGNGEGGASSSVIARWLYML